MTVWAGYRVLRSKYPLPKRWRRQNRAEGIARTRFFVARATEQAAQRIPFVRRALWSFYQYKPAWQIKVQQSLRLNRKKHYPFNQYNEKSPKNVLIYQLRKRQNVPTNLTFSKTCQKLNKCACLNVKQDFKISNIKRISF